MKKIKISDKKRFEDTEFYFDDCPICRAMRKANERERDLSFEELTKAFKEAREKGGKVGGSSF